MDTLSLQHQCAAYSVGSVGSLLQFSGKAFVKEVLGTTAVEVSFGSLLPGESSPFSHHHRQNEEVYIVVSGTGTFHLDGEAVALASGSVVRVAPAVRRSLSAGGDCPMVYLCIQGKEGSLEQYTFTDGVVEQG